MLQRCSDSLEVAHTMDLRSSLMVEATTLSRYAEDAYPTPNAQSRHS
jgi:hypothetical protein